MKIRSNRSVLSVSYHLLAGVLLTLPVIQSVSANQTLLTNLVSVETSNKATISTTADTAKWASWILSQVQVLPSVKAQEAETQKNQELSLAKQQPLYNPELSFSYTEKQAEEYGFTVSQTIDWYEKRLKNAKLGQVNYDLSLINNQLEVERKLAQALFSYVDYSKQQQLLTIAKNQEQLFRKFSDDLNVREKLGDVSSMDAEMAYLSITQNLQQISMGEIRYFKSLATLNESLNSQSIPYQPDLLIWENDLLNTELEHFLNSGLKTQLSEKRVKQSQQLSEIIKLKAKNNPTVGLGVGREGSENTLSLEFAIPLNINNNYSAEYRAALKQVAKSEFELTEQKRVLEKQINQRFVNYMELKKRVLKWEKLTTQRVKGSKKILTRLWQSGDIRTSDYLFSLQQRTRSMISTVELTSQMQTAWIEWLQTTNQIESWLHSLIKNKENLNENN